MPIKIADDLPARHVLSAENIFVMSESRAYAQDIRPLHIALLNLMPTKEATETQLLRLLSNSPLQVDITLLHPESHQSKNTPAEHLRMFYQTFRAVRHRKFDGLVITGAPVEHLPFEEVTYWNELKAVMHWAKHNVTSTMYICWAAQAALYVHYGIQKTMLPKKLFGVFPHTLCAHNHALTRGFDETFFAPQSRHTDVPLEAVRAIHDIDVLATSDDAGLYLAASRDGRHVFVTGHAEYDAHTLALEYARDVGRGRDIALPRHYFPDDDATRTPPSTWKAHAFLLFSNWMNYCVYQETPYTLGAAAPLPDFVDYGAHI
ncbi:MAG: homoserine O-succinyltransferase [Paenibacillaceae bacterium]|jgi:homoserine O-succinyltransferase|nr:homoserine O-succinyltransferase [Paenibacillaceae bacterium]